MKTPLIIAVCLCFTFIIGIETHLLAIPTAPIHYDVIAKDSIDLIQHEPKVDQQKEKNLYRLLSMGIVVMFIATIVGGFAKLSCNIRSSLDEDDANCNKHGFGISMFILSLLLLLRNKFTLRYQRRKEREKERMERRNQEWEEVEEDDDDTMIIF